MPYVYAVGELPGDFGFDPLRLGENKEALQWYQQAELQNGRQVQPHPPATCSGSSLLPSDARAAQLRGIPDTRRSAPGSVGQCESSHASDPPVAKAACNRVRHMAAVDTRLHRPLHATSLKLREEPDR